MCLSFCAINQHYERQNGINFVHMLWSHQRELRLKLSHDFVQLLLSGGIYLLDTNIHFFHLVFISLEIPRNRSREPTFQGHSLQFSWFFPILKYLLCWHRCHFRNYWRHQEACELESKYTRTSFIQRKMFGSYILQRKKYNQLQAHYSCPKLSARVRISLPAFPHSY